MLEVGSEGTALHLGLDWTNNTGEGFAIHAQLNLLNHDGWAHFLRRNELLLCLGLLFDLVLQELLVLLTAARS